MDLAIVIGPMLLATVAPTAAIAWSGHAGAADIALRPISVNLLNWSPVAGFASRAPAWYADLSGVVHLQGAAKQVSATGPDANLLGTLPKAARPGWTLFFIVHTFAGTYADLEIGTDGSISVIDPRLPAVRDYTFLSLEGISFRR